MNMIEPGAVVWVKVGDQQHVAIAGVTVGDRVYVEWVDYPYPSIAGQALNWHWPLVSECWQVYGRKSEDVAA